MNHPGIPVTDAKLIADTNHLDVCVVFGWRHDSGRGLFATYGRDAVDKHAAHNASELMAKALGFDAGRSTYFEDFRQTSEAARDRALLDKVREAVEKIHSPGSLAEYLERLFSPYGKEADADVPQEAGPGRDGGATA